MPAMRRQRLQEALREQLSEIILREMRDPRFREGLLSITETKVSEDLKYATVFVSVFGDDDARSSIMSALRGAARNLRGELGRRKQFVSVPELTFKYDDALERGARVFELIERVKVEDAARAAGELPNEPLDKEEV